MWAAILPLIEALGVGGATRAGATATESMAAKQSASLAGEQAAANSGTVQTPKIQKQQQAFDNLFEPTKAEKDEKAAREKQEEARKEKERKSDPGHQKATEWFQKSARYVDEKSLGQGFFDWMKKNDKSGVAGLAMAGMDLGASMTSRGLNASGKVIRDDFKGLADEILPDSLRKVVHAFDDLTRSIVEKGRYLARYSGELSQVTAQADVRRMQADLREARGPGRQYSRVIEQSSQLETQLRDALNPMKEAIAEGVANLLESINSLFEKLPIKESMAIMGEVAKVFAKLFTFDPEQVIDAIMNLPENLYQALTRERKEFGFGEAINNAKRDLQRQQARPPAKNKDFGNGRFNFPIAGGI